MFVVDPAVAQHHEVVGHAADLLEVVRDVEDRDPLLAQPPDDREQSVDLRLGQRGGGLVEDEHLWALDQGPREEQQLPVGDAQLEDVLAQLGLRPVQVEGGGDLPGPRQDPAQRPDRGDAALHDLFEAEVLGDGQAGHEAVADALVHGLDARLAGLARRAERHRFAGDEDLTTGPGVHPRQDLDQGALAGAVGAEQGGDPARGQRHRHALEHLVGAERHRHVPQLQHGCAGVAVSHHVHHADRPCCWSMTLVGAATSTAPTAQGVGLRT